MALKKNRWYNHKILWISVFVVVGLPAICGLAYILLAGKDLSSMASLSSMSGSSSHNYLTQPTTQSEGKIFEAKMQEQQKAGKPVFFEICNGDLCDQQFVELDKVAAKHKEVLFLAINNPTQTTGILDQLHELAGKVAYPAHVIIAKDGQYAETGTMSEDSLEKFITTSLESRVVKLDSKEAGQKMQARVASGKKSVLMVGCTADICAMEQEALEAIAKKYADKLIVVTNDPTKFPVDIIQQAMQKLGMAVLPIHVLIGPNGVMLLPGVREVDELSKFIDTGLTPMTAEQKAAMAAGRAQGGPRVAPQGGPRVAPQADSQLALPPVSGQEAPAATSTPATPAIPSSPDNK